MKFSLQYLSKIVFTHLVVIGKMELKVMLHSCLKQMFGPKSVHSKQNECVPEQFDTKTNFTLLEDYRKIKYHHFKLRDGIWMNITQSPDKNSLVKN